MIMTVVVPASCGGIHTNHYYVKPTDESEVECPPLDKPCHTLLEYITNETSNEFTANTAVLFLPGIHKVNSSNGRFAISNTENITLSVYKGLERWHELSVQIICQFPTMFVFFNVTNLQIENLSFLKCGHQIGPHYHGLLHPYEAAFHSSPDLNVALMFLHVNSLQASGLAVRRSIGYGFLGVNVLGRSQISYSVFELSNSYIEDYISMMDLDVCGARIEEGSSFCQGGNMVLVFVDPPGCNRGFELHTLDVHHSVFIGGQGTQSYVLGALFPQDTFPVVHGAGFSALFFQMSYGFSLILYGVTSSANRAQIGANFYFLIRNTTSLTYIEILSSHTQEGHIKLIRHNLDILKGAGLAFIHGAQVRNSLPSCPPGSPLFALGNLFNAKDVNFFQNSGFEGAGSFLLLQLDPEVPRVIISVENCTFLSNDGITGAAMEIEVDMRDIGLYSVRENFLDPLQFYSINITDTTFLLNPPEFIPIDFSVAILWAIQHETWKYLLDGILPESLSAYYYASIRSVVFLNKVENIIFNRCTFANNFQTAILALHSMFTFIGDTTFLSNSGAFGGAISLLDESIMYLMAGTTVNIGYNTALRGGGIYTTNSVNLPPVCFFQYDLAHYSSIQIVMQQNLAQQAGDDVYGGSFDSCSPFYETRNTLQMNVVFQIDNNSTSSISSAPERLCYCMDGKPICNFEEIDYVAHRNAYPGGSFTLSLVPVGQRNGTVPAVVHAGVAYGKAEFAPLQETQEINGTCTELKYSVASTENFTLVSILPQELTTDHPFDSWSQLPKGHMPIPFLVLVHFLPCPPGFTLEGDSGQCVCQPVLAELGVNCNISGDKPLIQRRESLWINLSLTGDDIIVHSHCPFDFCRSTEMWLDLLDPNSQCAFGHSGILCGECGKRLSFTLGSSHCKKCSSFHLFLFFPFLLAGFALVLLLIYCNITVSVGTVNGLIFYANLLRSNQAVFFLEDEFASESALNLQRFLSVFIAWLNLDLGIETCFYDGMDAYAHTWLQFLFPMYLWTIVGFMIVLCHYSSVAVKVIGTNAVNVLATLFLLSYAKLQRTVITVFSFTYIDRYYPDGSSHVVWLYDGNVPYLQTKHIPLFLMAVATTLFFIGPFTLFVLFAPCIQSLSEHRPMKWIHTRFKPLLDAYQAPFKDRFRYWAGLMLVVRNLLFISFALNILGDPSINLSIITTATLPLLMFSWFVHKSFALNAIETLFILNLSILSAWTHFNRTNANSSQTALVCTSTGIAFIVFLCILVYHMRQKLQKAQFFGLLKQQLPCVRNQPAANVNEVELEDREPPPVAAAPPVPCTFVELREPLLTDS